MLISKKGKSQFQRNLNTTIRNLVVTARISLHWMSYLPAYAVLLFGSDHYGSIGDKQMSSSAWQSTMMNKCGVADLWESQGSYATATKSHKSAVAIKVLNINQNYTESIIRRCEICIWFMKCIMENYSFFYEAEIQEQVISDYLVKSYSVWKYSWKPIKTFTSTKAIRKQWFHRF